MKNIESASAHTLRAYELDLKQTFKESKESYPNWLEYSKAAQIGWLDYFRHLETVKQLL